MKLINNIYSYVWAGQDNNCNTFLLANVLADHKHVIIDPGHVKTPQTGESGIERIFTEMQADELDPNSIGLVILTHWHPDHCESAAVLKSHLGAKIAIHELDAENFSNLGGSIDIFLREGELKLGTIEIDVFHSPGHSPGHITLYCKKEKVLVAGDLIFYHSTGRTDLPGGSMQQMKQSIDTLSKLDINYVLCGHPYGHPGIIESSKEVKANFEFLKEML